MSTGAIVAIVIVVVLIALMVVLYIVGNNMQKKQMEQREEINAAAQPVNMFVIDKKIMPFKDAKLPKVVTDQAPKRYKNAKIPVVKAKVGPQVMTLICDESVYDDVPKHGEVKAMVSGIYIVSVKTVHKAAKKALQEEQAENEGKKKSWRTRMAKKQVEYQKQLEYEMAAKEAKKDAKEKKAEEKKKREREKKITV